MTATRWRRCCWHACTSPPALSLRLAEVPLGLDHPYWVADPAFDIDHHLFELTLPAPGDDRRLAEAVAEIHARRLDRTRPLWEMHLIKGLRGGRVAVYTKVHHAAIDGVSGAETLAALLDLTPDGHLPRTAPAKAIPHPLPPHERVDARVRRRGWRQRRACARRQAQRRKRPPGQRQAQRRERTSDRRQAQRQERTPYRRQAQHRKRTPYRRQARVPSGPRRRRRGRAWGGRNRHGR
ncbi:wax ester/triacylglycerol synthase domain-containing protein [Nonomuraea salmonea]|uniref:wax ester/triacylglycerol synthase domain-containing protein n=1 Tax=Nonomuraea salmonea TaxID=46181 RepID=UPI002FE832C9